MSTGASDSSDRFLGIRAARDRRDTKYLIEALRDPDHRNFAADYLGELEAVEATEPLLRLLDAADPHVRIAASRALGRLHAREALPRLREIAREDDSAAARSWAIGALGDIGDGASVDLLIKLLADSSWRVRGAAALALGRIGDLSAIEPLRLARARLRRSPVEWYLYRRAYNRAVRALEKEG